MEWNQVLFKKFWQWTAGLGGSSSETSPHRVELEAVQDRLTILARALTGEAIEVKKAESEGGLLKHVFFLPAFFEGEETREDNLNFYLFRVCFLSVQKSFGLNFTNTSKEELESISSQEKISPLDISRQMTAKVAPEILTEIQKHYPGMTPYIEGCLNADRFTELTPDEQAYYWGHWIREKGEFSNHVSSPQNMVHDEDESKDDADKTTLESPVKEDVEVVQKDQKDIDNYTLLHQFEKVETIEEFNGNWRDLDGDDELDAHKDALDEVDLRHLVRTHDPAHSVYQAELFLQSGAPDSREDKREGFYLKYDEWDYKKSAYKPDYCRLYLTKTQGSNPNYYTKTMDEHRVVLNQLRQKFNLIFNQYEQIRKQTQGDELDLDAVVENYADLQAGYAPSEHIYFSKRRRKRELAILILIDLSLSTDAYTANQRIIDVEKKSVLLFGDILEEYGDHFQIDGFSSQTRNHCDYVTIKSFKDPWHSAKHRLGPVQPRGYTRMGPAIRHATHLISKEKVDQKWILLISDGKPNDYDRYEGKYGIQDVRQAIKEAKSERVQCFALAIESVARHYLPLMLGHGHFQILPHPQQLPKAMGAFYSRLVENQY